MREKKIGTFLSRRDERLKDDKEITLFLLFMLPLLTSKTISLTVDKNGAKNYDIMIVESSMRTFGWIEIHVDTHAMRKK